MNLKNRKRNFVYLITVLIFSFVVYVYMYSLIPIIENRLEKKIINISTGDIIDAITKSIYRNMPEGDFLVTVLSNRSYGKKLKKILSVFLTERLKYIFIIYKDYEGKYKYLLDVSSNDDFLNLLFTPLQEEKKILEEVYTKKKKRFKIHKEINTIGITYYIPVVQSGKVKSILIADFSFGVLQEIKSLILIIQRTVLISSGVILFFLAVAVYNFYRNVVLKQRA